jgi:hypothetical protein
MVDDRSMESLEFVGFMEIVVRGPMSMVDDRFAGNPTGCG